MPGRWPRTACTVGDPQSTLFYGGGILYKPSGHVFSPSRPLCGPWTVQPWILCLRRRSVRCEILSLSRGGQSIEGRVYLARRQRSCSRAPASSNWRMDRSPPVYPSTSPVRTNSSARGRVTQQARTWTSKPASQHAPTNRAVSCLTLRSLHMVQPSRGPPARRFFAAAGAAWSQRGNTTCCPCC